MFQVCHHYLVPLLSQIPLDSSLFKRDTSYSSMAPPESHEEGGDGVKENIDPLHQDLQVRHEEREGVRASTDRYLCRTKCQNLPPLSST